MYQLRTDTSSPTAPVKIRDFDLIHLIDETMMVKFADIYDADRWIIEGEGKTYELVDHYCKNEDCPCTEVTFVVLEDGQEVGKVVFDYRKNAAEESEYSFLLDEEIWGPGFLQIFRLNHEIIKREFRIFLLEREVNAKSKAVELSERLLREQNPPAWKKVGRNDPCPCGSGKKYKKCCL